jgi:ketosteroid isomerase-like protein
MEQLTAQNANTSFYQAFQQLSINQMDRIWSHRDDSICIHPGWELVIGWMAIKESWIHIFNKIEMMDIKTNTLRLRKCGNLAIFICLENIKISENGKIHRSCVLSTNVFEHSKGRWLLSHHQASSISNNLLLDIYNS